MRHIHSYPKVYSLGHPAIADLLDGPVVVEEKVDGSQFTFAVLDGELCLRSKGQDIHPDAPEAMFVKAVESVREREDALEPGFIYRAEFLQNPKHHTLAYEAVPEGHLLVFDIERAENDFLAWHEKRDETERIGLACSPRFAVDVSSMAALDEVLESESCLGGCLMEGVVIKNYARFGRDKKILAGKYVSERFKETHKTEWKQQNPAAGDVVQTLIEAHRTEARWEKAVQHLAERGDLEGADRDIGMLIKEVHRDIDEECREEIAAALVKWALPKVKRGAAGGLPEWYKRRLAERQFASAGSHSDAEGES